MNLDTPANPALHGVCAGLPALLTIEQLAKYVLNVSERQAQEIISTEPWAPAPIDLGPRTRRHSLAAWLAAESQMPRQSVRCEPSQLARSRALRSAPNVA